MIGSLREQLLILISTPFYIIIIGLELLLSHLQHRKIYSWKDTASNIYLMLLNAGIDLSFRAVYVAVYIYLFNHKILSWETGVSYWVLLILSEDFLYYWLHRFDHEIRLFWAVHVTHHSSERMNFSVGFRSSVFQPLYRFIYFIPLAWLGFRPLDILFVYSATQIWGIFVHTEMIRKMGWLEYILVTPSHHRVHHASNPKYLDKNMGMFLIVWDQLFGTFQPELKDSDYQQKKYGLTKEIDIKSPFKLVFHEWKDIRNDLKRKDLSLRAKWHYLFGPPGWSHDGSRLTSRELLSLEEARSAELASLQQH